MQANTTLQIPVLNTTFSSILHLVLINMKSSLFFYILFCLLSWYLAFFAGAVYFQAHDIFVTYNVAVANFLLAMATVTSIISFGICYQELSRPS